MKIQNIQTTNFQGNAIFVNNDMNSYGSKLIKKAVKQLNEMKVVKSNDFDIFVINDFEKSLKVVAADKKGDIIRYASQKVTTVKTTKHPEAVVGATKLVSSKHKNKLAKKIVEEEEIPITPKRETLFQKIKKVFNRK